MHCRVCVKCHLTCSQSVGLVKHMHSASASIVAVVDHRNNQRSDEHPLTTSLRGHSDICSSGFLGRFLCSTNSPVSWVLTMQSDGQKRPSLPQCCHHPHPHLHPHDITILTTATAATRSYLGAWSLKLAGMPVNISISSFTFCC